MNFSILLKLMRFWPPFLGSGIKVIDFNQDYTFIAVKMSMYFWNKNYVGTHFGGSLYAMTDPFYMLMLLHALGRNYIVWDKSASIRYKQPARGAVYAQFKLTPELIHSIKETLNNTPKTEREFMIEVIDASNNVVAEVRKILHISHKKKQN